MMVAHISITIGLHTKNKAYLGLGRRPELKSDEFFLWNPNINELSRCGHFFTAGKVFRLFHIREPDPTENRAAVAAGSEQSPGLDGSMAKLDGGLDGKARWQGSMAGLDGSMASSMVRMMAAPRVCE